MDTSGSEEEEVVVAEAKLSFSKLFDTLLVDSSGDMSVSGETRGDLENNLSNGDTDAILYKFSDPYIMSSLQALNYIASNPDLITAFGIDTTAASSHYTNYGISEGRSLTLFSASKTGNLKESFDLSLSKLFKV